MYWLEAYLCSMKHVGIGPFNRIFVQTNLFLLRKKINIPFSANGIRIKFFRSAKRPGTVRSSPLKGKACRKALSVMGDAIEQSSGVFAPANPQMLGLLWNETSRFCLSVCFDFSVNVNNKNNNVTTTTTKTTSTT